MSIFNRKRKKRSDSTYWLINDDIAYSKMIPAGYTRLDEIPQIVAGCRKIAELIGSMTIYLMANTEHGDVRITNELSRKIDINPCSVMNRSQFMEYIVMSMLLYGNGNAIVRVKTENGLLNDFQPIPADRFSFLPDQTGYKYKIVIDGVPYDPDEVLHFVYNPDKHYPWKGMGVRIPLNTIAKTVKQAQATKQAFMESKWMPSVIIKADAVADQFATPEGRHRLIEEYITTNKAGEPWVIPADQIDVTAVKPLSLKDIALADSMTQDTKMIAALIGVPAFLLGEGAYSQTEWNNFVNARIRPIVTAMQQEMTRKLILSPQWYLKFNQRALYDYDINTLANVYTVLQDRGDVSGNEVRDVLGMSPREGLDDLVRLENYIPNDAAGNQKKLTGGEGNE